MALLATFEKQPIEVLDYDIDYTAWLAGNDEIESVVATVTPESGMSADLVLIVDAKTKVKLWMHGGSAGTTYTAEITITTTDGRVKQDEVRFRCKEY